MVSFVGQMNPFVSPKGELVSFFKFFILSVLYFPCDFIGC